MSNFFKKTYCPTCKRKKSMSFLDAGRKGFIIFCPGCGYRVPEKQYQAECEAAQKVAKTNGKLAENT